MQSERGFTLIDTILMMIITGVGIFGIMSYFVSVNNQTMNGDMTVTASVLAQERLDRVVADKQYQGYNFVVDAAYPSPENLAAPFDGYTRTTTITEVSPNDLTTAQVGSGLKRVNIQVQWGPAASDRVQLVTLVTQY